MNTIIFIIWLIGAIVNSILMYHIVKDRHAEIHDNIDRLLLVLIPLGSWIVLFIFCFAYIATWIEWKIRGGRF